MSASTDASAFERLRRRYAGADKGRILKLVFYSAVLAGVGSMLLTGRSFSADDRLFAMVVGVPTLALTAVQLLFVVRPELRGRFGSDSDGASGLQEKFSASIEGRSAEGRPPAVRRKYELLLILWISALPLLMYVLGMSLVVPVYVFAFVWFFYGSPKAGLVTATVFTAITYLIFVVFLDLRPWPGILFG